MAPVRWFLILLGVVASAVTPVLADDRFDNKRASGQPYLTPEESLSRMRVPPGFEISVFAAEPDVINPVAFSVDERGRLWVVECFEYPSRTPKGKKPRDRIKILEDTDGDGKADKVTTWAEGKNLPVGWDLATGIEVGHGGAYLGAAPHLFFLKDKAGAGTCDSQEVLLSGFGSEDTHETLNTLQWGPDGRLYGLHGIFTRSTVGGTKMDAAVWRYDAGKKTFEVFAEGTSNPWGMDYDPLGQTFLACCVIPHAFHIIPGGRYIRQAGGSNNPYAYELLTEISDHLHHKESGWAHAGALVLQGDAMPPEYQGSMLMGSIHGCCVKRDRIERRGSSYVAKHAPDFLVSGDKNFRPINIRWGPDGSIYIIDWHDQNPCHQAAADSWDMTHGRIYKIHRTGAKQRPADDLGSFSTDKLVEALASPDPWRHRTAQRLLGERKDRTALPKLVELLRPSADDPVALRALWAVDAVGGFDERLAGDELTRSAARRGWAVRLLSENRAVSDGMLDRLAGLARSEPDAQVRLQLASAAQRLSGQNTLPLLHGLMAHAGDIADPCLPVMIWLAYEPRLAARRAEALDWLREHAAGNDLLIKKIVPFAMRRLAATGSAEDLAACLTFVEAVKDPAVRKAGLNGLLASVQNRQILPPPAWKHLYAAVRQDPDPEVQHLSHRLAVTFRDASAIHDALAAATDPKKSTAERTAAVGELALAHPPAALPPLLSLTLGEADEGLRSAACRALAAYQDQKVADALLGGWKSLPPPVRLEAVQVLSGRKEWAVRLLAAVKAKSVPAADLNNNVVLRMRGFRDPAVNGLIEECWGQVRDTPAELNALIEKTRATLSAGRASADRGKKVFEQQCAKCHKFEGRGHDLGPVLDGAARDLDYLLVNIIDPNRVVGAPYFLRLVELKNGRVETGLLAAEDDRSITLKTENDALKVIQKSDIEGKVMVQPKSVMPEGLVAVIKPDEFRDLVRYLQANPFLTEVAVAGPIPVGARREVPPADPLAATGLSWDWPVVGPSGRIELPPSPSGPDTLTYVAARVESPLPLATKLMIGSHQPLRAWLNGALVYERLSRSEHKTTEPDQFGIDVRLKAGENVLLFETHSRGGKAALYARLLDPNRKLKEIAAKHRNADR